MNSRVVTVLRVVGSGLHDSRNSPVSVSRWQLVWRVAANSSQVTLMHYLATAKKLVEDLNDQNIIVHAAKQRSERCAPAHFVEKPRIVPLALRLMVDYTRLNSCLIRDQAQVFPHLGGEET